MSLQHRISSKPSHENLPFSERFAYDDSKAGIGIEAYPPGVCTETYAEAYAPSGQDKIFIEAYSPVARGGTRIEAYSPVARGGTRIEAYSPASSGLDSSQEFDYPMASRLPPQNGKRCGVIFVDNRLEETSGLVGARDRARIHSFLVVCGRSSNIWSLPKGRMGDESESEEDCALREVFEETGIKLESVAGMPRIVIGRNVYFIYHTNKEHFTSFTIHDKFEVKEVAWKTLKELRKLTCNKDLRAVLRYPQRVYPYHQRIFHTSPEGEYRHFSRPYYSPKSWVSRKTCSVEVC